MKRYFVTPMITVAVAVLIVGMVVSAQDKSVKVPDGLALSEFKGYEEWPAVAPSHTDHSTKVILGNPIMMKAYRDGIPGSGKAVPDGAMMAKVEWEQKKDTNSPYDVTVPDTLKSLAFMVKDSKRFANTGGWAWAKFTYDPQSHALKPEGRGTACGYVCHQRVQSRDFVFTQYGRR